MHCYLNRYTGFLSVVLLLCLEQIGELGAQPVTDSQGDVGIGTNSPDPGAVLELHSTSKGFLMPRMTTAQRNAIPNPAPGLLIYNLDSGSIDIWSSESGTFGWEGVVTTATEGTFWRLDGNSGTVPGTSFVGTTDNTALHLYVNHGASNSLVLNQNGSLQHGLDGNERGDEAVDLQVGREDATQVASGRYSTIGGGRENSSSGIASTVSGGRFNDGSGDDATISGGQLNQASEPYATVGGGVGNGAMAEASTVGGGALNRASGDESTVSGGVENEAAGEGSTIPGGGGLTLDENADWSFGFLANRSQNGMVISEPEVAVFGNTDLWLANNDTAASQLRFYEPNSAIGAFPNGTSYTSFEAGSQREDIIYILPPSTDSIDILGKGILQLQDSTGQLNWVDPEIVRGEDWRLSGNEGTVPGINFVGTSDSAALQMQVRYTEGYDRRQTIINSLILNVSGGIQRDSSGDVRGDHAVDLQINRRNTTEVASGEQAVIGGGFANLASGDLSTVSGGGANQASGEGGTVGGGENNVASGLLSAVGGGYGNVASKDIATVAGGIANKAEGDGATVSGGGGNISSGEGSTVGGGEDNQALNDHATVSGGYSNTASGEGSAILGGFGLELDSMATLSFGFFAGTEFHRMTISEPEVAVFGNVDLWLVNNDTAASQLRFYEAESDTGDFPSGTNYTAFKAGVQNSHILYVLPTPAGTPTAGQVLAISTVTAATATEPMTIELVWQNDATIAAADEGDPTTSIGPENGSVLERINLLTEELEKQREEVRQQRELLRVQGELIKSLLNQSGSDDAERLPSRENSGVTPEMMRDQD